ncbi:Halomucin [Bienertia sinuspersici]
MVIFKEWREQLALREYKFAETAVWVRVEGLPASVNQTSLAVNILEHVGVCIFLDKDNDESKPQRSTRARLWLNLRKPLIPGVFLELQDGTMKWVDIRYKGVFIFCKKYGMIGHKTDHCKTPTEKVKERIWEAIAKMCKEGEEIIFTPHSHIPLYTNKIKGLKSTPNLKTTPLNIKVSATNFEQASMRDHSDSSSENEETSDEEENEEQGDNEEEEDPTEDDSGPTEDNNEENNDKEDDNNGGWDQKEMIVMDMHTTTTKKGITVEINDEKKVILIKNPRTLQTAQDRSDVQVKEGGKNERNDS